MDDLSMRVFIGLKEVANNTYVYGKAFQALGHKTRTVVWYRNPFYRRSQYDVVLSELVGPPPDNLSHCELLYALKRTIYEVKKLGIVIVQFLIALATCELFVFMWGTSFLPRYWDYAILKLFRKRLISVFCGTDIRYWHAFEEEAFILGRDKGVKPFVDYLKGMALSQPAPPTSLIFRPYIDFTPDRPDDFFIMKMTTVRAAERYADLILSQPNMGQLQTRRYMRFKAPLDLSQYHFHISERSVPLVLHAPSNRGVKGTEYVVAAIKQLKREGLSFDFQLVENTPNEIVRSLLEKSDIVIDQLMLGAFALFALESLATGNVVLAHYLSDREQIPTDCPIVNVTSNTLVNKLRQVILDAELRKSLVYAGRRYAEHYHAHVHVVREILECLESKTFDDIGLLPTFYSHGFVMSIDLLRREALRMLQQEKRWLRPVSARILRRRIESFGFTRGRNPLHRRMLQ